MKGYESCYDCERETQEEGADEHSEKITNGAEKGSQVEGVSCTRPAVGGDGTERKRQQIYMNEKQPVLKQTEKTAP